MGGAMKYFPKKILGHAIVRSMVSWDTKFVKPSAPFFILNVHSLIEGAKNKIFNRNQIKFLSLFHQLLVKISGR